MSTSLPHRLTGPGRPLHVAGRCAWLVVLLLAFTFGPAIGLATASGSTLVASNTPASVQKNSTAKSLIPGGDLDEHERAGGHLLARHVGKTEEQLRQRLKSDTRISAASSFTDRIVADTTVAAAIAANRGRIGSWLQGNEPRLVLSYRQSQPCGISLSRKSPKAREARAARLVLIRDPKFMGGWRILTGYPEL